MLDSWLPDTHAAYLDEFGADLTDLGPWYTEARTTIVNNDDAPITSLDELAANADLFGNRVVGLEPGAGMMKTTEDHASPMYGLEEIKFLTSSTAVLLTELQAADAAGENIVATLARPHWAYEAYGLRDLEDPEGAMGAAEEIHGLGSPAFDDDFPTAGGWLRDFAMSDDELLSLCDLLFNENSGSDYEPLVREWMDEHAEFVDELTA
jgi:glycine betaine/proline transport system substrate-binding protein